MAAARRITLCFDLLIHSTYIIGFFKCAQKSAANYAWGYDVRIFLLLFWLKDTVPRRAAGVGVAWRRFGLGEL